MNTISRQELNSLMNQNEGPCVSIFIPTARTGAETQQPHIRLRNLLRHATEQLVASGLKSLDAKRILEPAQQLVAEGLFWQHQENGLVLFLSAGFFRFFQLPVGVKEGLVVANRFHIKPLMPLLDSAARFYILALSQKEVKLFRGDHFNIEQIRIKDVPQSLAEVLRYENPEKQLPVRNRPAQIKGTKTSTFHGHGSGPDDVLHKKEILRFFQQVDKGLHDYIRGERIPLVLAGVEYLLPIYRECNTYPHLIGKGIVGNADVLPAEVLHQQAWTILQPHFQKEQEAARMQYERFAGSERVSNMLQEVLPAICNGRVDSLFVALDEQQWGTFDSQSGKITLQSDSRPGNEDLLNLAAIQTITRNGVVFAVEREHVPDKGLLAAVYRY